ncbi:hypothetical protein TrST_g8429 [Triparma strigata]|uniref:Uncharacterized protein n=1 Tax=Triparma strigata TaxID=1606541 RepID=A0A9W7AD65_9STRA|nr:hypothetical protein TrST_g8429 [Triparma strigata]
MTLLSAALSHWGADVLIIDPNKNYGGNAFTGLAHDIADHKPTSGRITKRPDPLPAVDSTVDTPYGKGVWKKKNYNSFQIQLPYGTLYPDPSTLVDYSRLTIPFLTLPLIFSDPSTSIVIPTLLNSSVSEYIRFKALSKTSVVKDGVKSALPCSRADVYNDESLSLLDKNKILKILRLAHTSNLASDELDKESSTTSSRALRAPQNSTPLPTSSSSLTKIDFKEYLTSKLSPSKVPLIHPGLTLTLSPLPASAGLKILSNHIKSLDVHSSLPYISPIYGLGELCQGFARKASVLGCVFILECEVEIIKGGVKLNSERIGWKDVIIKGDNVIQQSKEMEGGEINKVWGFIKGSSEFSVDVNEDYIVVRGGETMKFTNVRDAYYVLVYSLTMSFEELNEVLEEEPGEVIMKGECREAEYKSNLDNLEVGGGTFEKDFNEAKELYERLRSKDERLGEWFGDKEVGGGGNEDEVTDKDKEEEDEGVDEDEDEDEEARALREAMKALQDDADLEFY